MAERRMFAKTIIDSDAFMTMPLSSQALYFHLGMRGDDEGFVNKPKSLMRTIGASEDDLKILISKHFVIPFESGVVVIKHWKIHNYIRGDRLSDTVYQDERQLLDIKENGAYTLSEEKLFLSDECQSKVGQLSDKRQHRLGKVSIGKDNIYTPEFENFWIIYPRTRRMSKKNAFKAWNARLNEKYTPEMILEGTKGYAVEVKGKEEKFIKQPETFLGPGIHFECYLDAPHVKPEAPKDPSRIRYEELSKEWK